jgi:hypothetical protein
MKISENIKANIKKISEKRSISKSELEKELLEISNREYVQTYPETERLHYAMRLLWSKHMSKGTVKEFNLIVPIGVTEKRKTRGGNWRSEIYFLVRVEEKEYAVKEAVCTGTLSGFSSEIELFKAYTDVKLSDKSGFVEISSTDELKNGSIISENFDEIEFLEDYCKYKRVETLDKMPTSLSKLNDGGYIEKTSMYIISGIVTQCSKGVRKDDSKYGVYSINDMSLDPEDTTIETEDGVTIILPSEITIWIAPRFVKYDKESEVAFLGNIQVNKNNEVFMNAVVAIPDGLVIEIEEEKEEE